MATELQQLIDERLRDSRVLGPLTRTASNIRDVGVGGVRATLGGAYSTLSSIPVLGAQGLDLARSNLVRWAGGQVTNPNLFEQAYVNSPVGSAGYHELYHGSEQFKRGLLGLLGGEPAASTQQNRATRVTPPSAAPASAPAEPDTESVEQPEATAEHVDQARIDEFNAKPATVGRGFGVNTGNVVPAEFFTGWPGARAASKTPAQTLPQPRGFGVGGGQVSFIRDAGGRLTPGSRMFDPVAFRAALAQDRVNAQRDVAQTQANAQLTAADLTGQYGVINAQAAAQAAQAEGQSAAALERLKAELEQTSPQGLLHLANARTQLQRQQMIAQAIADGVPIEQLLAPSLAPQVQWFQDVSGNVIGYGVGNEIYQIPPEVREQLQGGL